MTDNTTKPSLQSKINTLIAKAQDLDKAGHVTEAEQVLKLILKSYPFSFSAAASLAILYFNERKYNDAITYAQEALMINPNNLGPLMVLGVSFCETGKLIEGLEYFDKAIKLFPREVASYEKAATYLRANREYEEALNYLKKGLSVVPDSVELYSSFPILSLLIGDFDDAHDYFHLNNKKLRGEYWNNIDKNEFEGIIPKNLPEYKGKKFASPFKIEHDIQQLEYLIEHKKIDKGFNKVIDSYKFAVDEFKRLVPEDNKHFAYDTLLPDNPKLDLFRKCFNRPIYIPHIPKMKGPVINPDLDFRKIEDEYFSSTPSAIYFDDFLTEDALNKMRNYCLEATIWSESKNTNYLGAYLNVGFANHLNLFVAQEMKRLMPNIFNGHMLQELWSFKYGPEIEGIPTYADEAAVNVNFWITPSDANLDKDSGGLEVFTKAAPLEWSFEEFNSKTKAINNFLEQENSGSIIIPHKQNRAVMFDSNLFHKTDTIKFKDNYESRRLNVTMLYGHRK